MNGEIENVLDICEKNGIAVKAVPVWHLEELRSEFQRLRGAELIDREIDRRYLSNFRYQYEKRIPQARSVIVAAIPRPAVELRFDFRGRSYRAVIPPTYISPEVPVEQRIKEFFSAGGYTAYTQQEAGCRIPLKLLAARSGLCRYGRNNITYSEKWGSYISLTGMFSDYPGEGAGWADDIVMPECENCDECARRCPNGCIAAGRRTIHASRCLTFFNESPGEFPGWISKGAHNAVIGCLHCQEACPVNRGKLKVQVIDPAFAEFEVDMMLRGRDFGLLPERTQKLISQLELEEEYKNGTLTRNLKALLRLLP